VVIALEYRVVFVGGANTSTADINGASIVVSARERVIRDVLATSSSLAIADIALDSGINARSIVSRSKLATSTSSISLADRLLAVSRLDRAVNGALARSTAAETSRTTIVRARFSAGNITKDGKGKSGNRFRHIFPAGDTEDTGFSCSQGRRIVDDGTESLVRDFISDSDCVDLGVVQCIGARRGIELSQVTIRSKLTAGVGITRVMWCATGTDARSVRRKYLTILIRVGEHTDRRARSVGVTISSYDHTLRSRNTGTVGRSKGPETTLDTTNDASETTRSKVSSIHTGKKGVLVEAHGDLDTSVRALRES